MPNIAVVCPRCQSNYQVDAGLRGKKMRCPNTICRAVFDVQEVGAAQPPAPPGPPESPPIAMPVEPPKPREQPPPPKVPVARPVSPPPPTKAPEWQAGPPPVRGAAPVAAVVSAPAPALTGDFPGDEDDTPGAVIAPEPRPETPKVAVAPTAPAQRSRRSLAVIAVMLAVLAGGGAAGWWLYESTRAGSERERYERAEQLYRDQEFAAAAKRLQELFRDFPDSPDARKYRLLAELSDVRQAAYTPAENPEETTSALQRVRQFLGVYQNDPLLKDRHADVWQTLHRLADQLARQAEQHHDPAALDLARRAWAEAKKYQPPPGVNAAEAGHKLAAEFTRVEKALTDFAERQGVIDTLQQQLERTTAAGVRDARALVKRAGLEKDREIAGLLDELVKQHRAQVRFTPAEDETSPAVAQDTLPSLAVTPLLHQGEREVVTEGVVLALARGVLYALEPAKGELRWARRVGVDTQALPIRVPPDAITPALLLVSASDSRSITAVVAETGHVVWQRALAEPCLGRPVLVGRSLLVPTLGGRVEELEIAGGRRLGSYDLGQRLSLGGVRQEGTSLVVFPADEFCVYVLDAARRTCEAVLYTAHPAGSLRGLPVVLSEAGTGGPAPGAKGDGGWLFLCQAQGLDAVEVRPYALPVQDPDQKPADPVVRVAGWSWFAPWHDAEKLALATDGGLLSLWGIRQKGNRDPLLFRLLKDDYLVDEGRTQARAQVVHADAEGYWVLARGRLHRLRFGLKPDTGPALTPLWPEPPALGSPLHAAEHQGDGTNRRTLFLTTQPVGQPAAVCSAVDAGTGEILWQRQLGCTPLAPPVALAGQVLLRDAGGLLRFDADKATESEPAWRTAGERVAPAPAGHDHALLLAGTKEAIELSWPASVGAIKLRAHRTPAGGEKPTLHTFELPAAPLGSPALADDAVIVPLANGVAARLDFKDNVVFSGPDWRSPSADEQAPGHAVALGGGDFLLTDGSRGVSRYHWPSAKVWEKRRGEALSHRIVAPPVVLRGKEGPARVIVADASDTVTLLDGERLQPLRRWTLPGKLTAGPFAHGGNVSCVVDRKRLVVLDPDRDAPAWEYGFDAEVIGPPLLVDDVLVVADVAGQLRALDPATGTPLGRGYTFRADVAPASAPVPFGEGRVLVPLTDGTLVVVTVAALR